MPEFKLSGVSKSELKPGFMKEVEVEGIKDAKLLLVQVGDKLQATSPKCTHYVRKVFSLLPLISDISYRG